MSCFHTSNQFTRAYLTRSRTVSSSFRLEDQRASGACKKFARAIKRPSKNMMICSTTIVLFVLFSYLTYFHALHRKNGTTDVMQRSEYSNQGGLVCQSTCHDRHRTLMRIAFVLDGHPSAIIRPILVQGALDTDPVPRWFYETGTREVLLHSAFLC